MGVPSSAKIALAIAAGVERLLEDGPGEYRTGRLRIIRSLDDETTDEEFSFLLELGGWEPKDE